MQEDILLCEGVEKFGRCWAAIDKAGLLPRRCVYDPSLLQAQSARLIVHLTTESAAECLVWRPLRTSSMLFCAADQRMP